jgi:hypothetical protein
MSMMPDSEGRRGKDSTVLNISLLSIGMTIHLSLIAGMREVFRENILMNSRTLDMSASSK